MGKLPLRGGRITVITAHWRPVLTGRNQPLGLQAKGQGFTRAFSPKPFPKLTKAWKWLDYLNILLSMFASGVMVDEIIEPPIDAAAPLPK